ncbi:uncharacterized protein LOC62_06G007870 [Vanrija pseudolonga]|uniref:Uncharacterized protein n=1 Tax=Vanrija pseudolonga TaxID=143232 RepID=A0AAF0YCT0_9TREE|nr:hypothetical protein LOC62_06G007870 [Vanrija pseudolonga]
MPPAPKEMQAAAKPYGRRQKPTTTQADTLDDVKSRACMAASVPPGGKHRELKPPAWAWDGARIADIAAKLRFSVNPPFKVKKASKYSTTTMKTSLGVAVNANLSEATEIVFSSNDRFEFSPQSCAHCATVGNDYCFSALGYPSTSCLLCLADGVRCSNKKKSARQRRRDAMLKLSGAVTDREWAAKIFKEYENAEEDEDEED